MGSAYVNFLDDVTGSLEPGKLADLAVLDRDVLDPGAGSIADARVLLTLVEGEAVYADPGARLVGGQAWTSTRPSSTRTG